MPFVFSRHLIEIGIYLCIHVGQKKIIIETNEMSQKTVNFYNF